MSERTGWLRAALLSVLAVVAACEEMPEPGAPAAGEEPVIAQEVVRLLSGDRAVLTLRNGGTSVAWMVRDTDVASIDGAGVLRAESPGMTWAYAEAVSSRDSVRVVVSFDDAPSGTVAFSLGRDNGSLQLHGSSRIVRPANGSGSFTDILASAGPEPRATINIIDSFVRDDTVVVMRLAGEPATGFREVTPWDVTKGPEGSLHVRGNEGAFVWMPVPGSPDQAVLYVPVTPLQLEIDESTIPAEIGPASGRLAGRVSFDAAGLIIQSGENGLRIVGQASPDVVSFFAEFQLAQRVEQRGAGRLTVTGGPITVSEMSMSSVRAEIWKDGLVLNTGLAGNVSGALASVQVRVGSPAIGDHPISELRVGQLLDRTALIADGVLVWTETGMIADKVAGNDLPNLGLSESGTLSITRYDPPGAETWGWLEARIETQQYLSVGGAPEARQTVVLEVSAPVTPEAAFNSLYVPKVAYKAFGEPGTLRVSNGELEVDGRTHELFRVVPDVEVTLTWPSGSATVRSSEWGRFSFTGLHPGEYQIEFEVPPGYTLAHGQSTSVGPLHVTHDRNPHSPVFVPIDLADADGNGVLVVTAMTTDPVNSVGGLSAHVRAAGSTEVLTTIVTGSDGHSDPDSRVLLQPGTYVVDFEPPAGYDLADRQLATVTLEVFGGRIALREVLLEQGAQQ